jgi:aryl-alcohol dehydrogenase-like predicted oxidoreductase
MTPFFTKHGIQILTYGTLLGGFFSEKYLNTDEPNRGDLTTASLQKYKNMIDAWGGWQLFQELLQVLNGIAKKHDCSIANIATRFILDKPQVAGVIIGTRLGITNHREDNSKVFELKLDQEDISSISTITSKSNDLFDVIGDCGSEYR